MQIDAEFRALIPPLQEDERAKLEQSILNEGCRDALVVWQSPDGDILIDGHNRHDICTAHNLPYDVVTRDFASRDDVKLWMIRNQLARRNLTPFNRTELALQMESVIAELAKQNQAQYHGNQHESGLLANLPEVQSVNTRDELARIAETSSRNVDKVKKVLADAPDAIKQLARSGDISIHRASEITKQLQNQPQDVVDVALRVAGDNPEKIAVLSRLYKSSGNDGSNGTFDEIARTGGFHHGDDMDDWLDFADASYDDIKRALDSVAKYHAVLELQRKQLVRESRRDERIAAQTAVPDQLSGVAYELIHADIRHIADSADIIPSQSIDAIITDPPYPREYLDLYDTLGALAKRVLKPNGIMVVMSGQSYLPEVIQYLDNHLQYHWTLAYMTPGAGPTIWQRNVNTFWKPLLWYVNGDYDGYWQSDVIQSERGEKSHHEWQQSVSGMDKIIEKFTLPDNLILDPFCGAGTTGVAAVSQHRRFIGIDIDETALQSSEERLKLCLKNQ